MADSLILMVLALVVFGPRRLPQIGRQIGKLMYEFRKASNDFKFQMEEELRAAEDADRRKKDEERMKALATVATAPQIAASDPEPVTFEAVHPTSPTPADIHETTPDAVDALPRIMPPSTGEPVAAARPGQSVHSETSGVETTDPEAAPAIGDTVRIMNGVVVPAHAGPAQAEPSTEFHEEQVPTEPVTHND